MDLVRMYLLLYIPFGFDGDDDAAVLARAAAAVNVGAAAIYLAQA